MKHLVFLLEEPSARDALEVWTRLWVPAEVGIHFQVFQGKQDLEKRMVLRIREWLLPESRFVVMRAQHSRNLGADRPIAQRGALGGAGDDPDVERLGHAAAGGGEA